MTRAKKDARAELEKSAALLRALRDEVRLTIRASGMDTKDTWSELEASLEAALDGAAKDVSDGAHVALAELAEAHRKLRDWHR